MAKIGFIGASGLMGHGMAKNLLAKGHTLALTVHRNRERVADLLAAGATEAPSAQPRWPRSRARLHLRHRLAAGRGGGAGRRRAAGRRAPGPDDRRLLDQRTRLHRRLRELPRSACDFVDAPLARTPVEAEPGG
jgi:hypothetical protein